MNTRTRERNRTAAGVLTVSIAIALIALATGCESTGRPWARARDDDANPARETARAESGGAETWDAADSGTRKMIQGFFKGTRLPGGLSSEAAEIERNLGVN